MITRHQQQARSIWREVITIIETLITSLEYPFVRYALIVGVLIALCSSLLGVILVLKRFSYIGDGLSHVAFGAMAVAAVVGLSDRMVLTLPITIVCAILLLWTGQNTKIKGDAAIAMISVGALAVGYLLMNLFPTSSNISGDVYSTVVQSFTHGNKNHVIVNKEYISPDDKVLIVDDFLATGAALVGRTPEQQKQYDYGRNEVLPDMILALAGG